MQLRPVLCELVHLAIVPAVLEGDYSSFHISKGGVGFHLGHLNSMWYSPLHGFAQGLPQVLVIQVRDVLPLVEELETVHHKFAVNEDLDGKVRHAHCFEESPQLGSRHYLVRALEFASSIPGMLCRSPEQTVAASSKAVICGV